MTTTLTPPPTIATPVVPATPGEELKSHRTPYQPRNSRRILCVFPKYSRSFGTFHHAYPLMGRVKAFMPPQGILVVAAYLPESWEVRFIDENKQTVKGSDFQWADAVIVSGMHIQRPRINAINEQAHRYGKVTIVGRPCPVARSITRILIFCTSES